MWRDSRSNNDFSALFCENCENNLCSDLDSHISYSTVCRNCNKIKKSFRCTEIDCNFRKSICLTCDLKQLRKNEAQRSTNNICFISQISTSKLFISASLVVMLLAWSFRYFYSGAFKDSNVNLIEQLKKNYPLQSNDTWYHFLSVLEKESLSVKSITFLHGEDKRTSDCLRNDLGFEAKDYGFILEYYRARVQKFRLLVTNLTEVTGNIARIFHSLCDEVSSDIKPSLFIFTLKYEKNNENLKPLARATAILKEAWSDLPENEIFPLFSRVIKNVVDVVPEKEVNC